MPPANLTPSCYNGYDHVWAAPEQTQPAFDHGIAFTSPPPCTANGGCLFDVKADPAEAHDLAADPAHADTMERMLRRYAELAVSEVSMEAAQLCPIPATPSNNGCRANLQRRVWGPGL